MKLFWTFLVAIVLVALLYTVVHRILINRATIMMRRRAQQVTDQAVNASLRMLLAWDQDLNSELVADVWGKGVLAFEYHFPAGQLGNLTRDRLNRALDDYADREELTVASGSQRTFVVTDWWQYEGVQHIDVAYLLNEATKEYVADLKKLDRN